MDPDGREGRNFSRLRGGEVHNQLPQPNPYNTFDFLGYFIAAHYGKEIKDYAKNPVGKYVSDKIIDKICSYTGPLSDVCSNVLDMDFLIPSLGDATKDPYRDPESGKIIMIDIKTGFKKGPKGELIGPKGELMDRETQLPIRPITNRPHLPETNIDIDPITKNLIDRDSGKPIPGIDGKPIKYPLPNKQSEHE